MCFTVKTAKQAVARSSGIVRLKPPPVRASSGKKVLLRRGPGGSIADASSNYSAKVGIKRISTLKNGQSSTSTAAVKIKLSTASTAETASDLSSSKQIQFSNTIKLSRPANTPVSLTSEVRKSLSEQRTTVRSTGLVRTIPAAAKFNASVSKQHTVTVSADRLPVKQETSSTSSDKQQTSVASVKHRQINLINKTLSSTTTGAKAIEQPTAVLVPSAVQTFAGDLTKVRV